MPNIKKKGNRYKCVIIVIAGAAASYSSFSAIQEAAAIPVTPAAIRVAAVATITVAAALTLIMPLNTV